MGLRLRSGSRFGVFWGHEFSDLSNHGTLNTILSQNSPSLTSCPSLRHSSPSWFCIRNLDCRYFPRYHERSTTSLPQSLTPVKKILRIETFFFRPPSTPVENWRNNPILTARYVTCINFICRVIQKKLKEKNRDLHSKLNSLLMWVYW